MSWIKPNAGCETPFSKSTPGHSNAKLSPTRSTPCTPGCTNRRSERIKEHEYVKDLCFHSVTVHKLQFNPQIIRFNQWIAPMDQHTLTKPDGEAPVTDRAKEREEEDKNFVPVIVKR